MPKLKEFVPVCKTPDEQRSLIAKKTHSESLLKAQAARRAQIAQQKEEKAILEAKQKEFEEAEKAKAAEEKQLAADIQKAMTGNAPLSNDQLDAIGRVFEGVGGATKLISIAKTNDANYKWFIEKVWLPYQKMKKDANRGPGIAVQIIGRQDGTVGVQVTTRG